MILHASRIVRRADCTIYTTLCGRMNARSRDGMNIADTAAEVTCKLCLRRMAAVPEIPADFPVQPLAADAPAKDRVTCGTCGLSWDDGVATSYTPAPAGRCPFEYFHKEPRT